MKGQFKEDHSPGSVRQNKVVSLAYLSICHPELSEGSVF